MNYLWPCLVFVWSAYIWETYLQWRQRRVYRTATRVPSELQELIDQKTLDKSRHYQLDRSSFALAFGLFKQIEFLVIILVGAIPLAWHAAGGVTATFGFGPEYEITQSIVFLLLTLVYSDVTSLPWSAYSTFVVEEKHGFNKQTAGFFVKDHLKSFALQSVLVPLILSGLIAVIHWGGEYFYIYAWVFLLVVSLVFLMVYHDYIAPLFDKFTPLPEGDLMRAIEGLASTLNFPLKQVLVVEGSKRSAHSNAYFFGFWKKKRIVLFDTLLEKGLLPEKFKSEQSEASKVEGEGEGKESKVEKEEECEAEKEDVREVAVGEEKEKEWEAEKEDVGEEKEKEWEAEKEDVGEEKEASEKESLIATKRKTGCNTEEVLAVLAHELGHWSMSHAIKNICIAEANFFLTLMMFGYFINQQDLFASFGFPDSRPTVIGLIVVFELIFIPYFELFQFLMVQLTRRFEYQADSFARRLRRGSALRTALTKLQKDNLSFPIADSLYSAFHNSHPTFLERVRALSDKED